MEKMSLTEYEKKGFAYGVVIGQLQHIRLLVTNMLEHQWLGDEDLPRELVGDITVAIDRVLQNLISSNIFDEGEDADIL